MKHGTRSCYVSGCRCEACTKANSVYYKRNQMNGSNFVSAGATRKQVRKLLRNGWSERGICREAGVSRSTMHNLMTAHWRSGKPVSKIYKATHEAIMALPVNPPYEMGAHHRIPKLYKTSSDEPYYMAQRRASEAVDDEIKRMLVS